MDRLDSQVDLTKMFFAVNTNGSIIPSDDILEYFYVMDRVNIDVSIDAVGDLAECIRHGIAWDVIYSNLVRWTKIARVNPNINIKIHSSA